MDHRGPHPFIAPTLLSQQASQEKDNIPIDAPTSDFLERIRVNLLQCLEATRGAKKSRWGHEIDDIEAWRDYLHDALSCIQETTRLLQANGSLEFSTICSALTAFLDPEYGLSRGNWYGHYTYMRMLRIGLLKACLSCNVDAKWREENLLACLYILKGALPRSSEYGMRWPLVYVECTDILLKLGFNRYAELFEMVKVSDTIATDEDNDDLVLARRITEQVRWNVIGDILVEVGRQVDKYVSPYVEKRPAWMRDSELSYDFALSALSAFNEGIQRKAGRFILVTPKGERHIDYIGGVQDAAWRSVGEARLTVNEMVDHVKRSNDAKTHVDRLSDAVGGKVRIVSDRSCLKYILSRREIWSSVLCSNDVDRWRLALEARFRSLGVE